LFNTKKIEEINSYLWSIKEDIESMIESTSKWKDLELGFNKAVKYRDVFMYLDKKLNDISNKLNLK
jgi:hypothetical protein